MIAGLSRDHYMSTHILCDKVSVRGCIVVFISELEQFRSCGVSIYEFSILKSIDTLTVYSL